MNILVLGYLNTKEGMASGGVILGEFIYRFPSEVEKK